MLNLLWHCGTERLGDFWKRWVSRSCLGVFLCCLCLCFVCVVFCFHRHLAFLLTYSPTCGNSQSKPKRFYDRLSFERARHGHKKKVYVDETAQGSGAIEIMIAIMQKFPHLIWESGHGGAPPLQIFCSPSLSILLTANPSPGQGKAAMAVRLPFGCVYSGH